MECGRPKKSHGEGHSFILFLIFLRKKKPQNYLYYSFFCALYHISHIIVPLNLKPSINFQYEKFINFWCSTWTRPYRQPPEFNAKTPLIDTYWDPSLWSQLWSHFSSFGTPSNPCIYIYIFFSVTIYRWITHGLNCSLNW